MKRTTIRFNDLEETELELLKKTFHITDDSKAVKMAIEWVNSYLKNVSTMFFPQNYNVILSKKLKNEKLERRVY